MNNILGKNIRKHRELKGFSQEYMAHQLDLNQASYAKIENNTTKMTIDRLFSISKLLEIDVAELLELSKQNVYNVYDNQNAIGHQQVENLHQENKEVYQELIKAKDEQITLLKEMLQKK
ncbi:helix-turn-helix domain-containing protein [Halpernia sp.]|uniref:helix-turn-helix domain-containing protein n=1 Tax=Halpernia sp. TaxID=2782209 RepID=UPI003A8FC507